MQDTNELQQQLINTVADSEVQVFGIRIMQIFDLGLS
jgi:hypothetical protein